MIIAYVEPLRKGYWKLKVLGILTYPKY